MGYDFNLKNTNAKNHIVVTKIVSIYARILGKFLDYGKYACVKDSTNIMSTNHALVVDLDRAGVGIGLGWTMTLKPQVNCSAGNIHNFWCFHMNPQPSGSTFIVQFN